MFNVLFSHNYTNSRILNIFPCFSTYKENVYSWSLWHLITFSVNTSKPCIIMLSQNKRSSTFIPNPALVCIQKLNNDGIWWCSGNQRLMSYEFASSKCSSLISAKCETRIAILMWNMKASGSAASVLHEGWFNISYVIWIRHKRWLWCGCERWIVWMERMYDK